MGLKQRAARDGTPVRKSEFLLRIHGACRHRRRCFRRRAAQYVRAVRKIKVEPLRHAPRLLLTARGEGPLQVVQFLLFVFRFGMPPDDPIARLPFPNDFERNHCITHNCPAAKTGCPPRRSVRRRRLPPPWTTLRCRYRGLENQANTCRLDGVKIRARAGQPRGY
jgi:hypothetical protein